MSDPSANMPEVKPSFRPVWWRSLLFRFNLVFVLILVFMLFGVTSLLGRVWEELLFKEVQGRIRQKVMTASEHVARNVQYAEGIVRALATMGETLPKDEALIRASAEQLLDIAGQGITGGGLWPEPYAFDATRENRSFFWARDATGILRYIDDYNQPNTPSYHNAPWYVPATFLKRGQCYWSDAYWDEYAQASMVTCSAPIMVDNVLKGVATVDLELDWLDRLFEREAGSLGGYFFAIDRDGGFLSFPAPKLLQNPNCPQAECANVEQLAASDDRFQPFMNALMNLDARIQDAAYKSQAFNENLASQLQTRIPGCDERVAQSASAFIQDPYRSAIRGSEFHSIQLDDDLILREAALGEMIALPETYWKIAVVFPISRIKAAAEGTAVSIWLPPMVSGFLMLLFVFIFVRRTFIRPLRQITQALAKAGQNTPEHMPVLKKLANDEFGALVDAFNDRTEALRSANQRMQEEIIERKIAELEVRELNEQLEHRVADRTRELEASLQQLRETQNQLIESEKLAALANLVAGVAHEINTPVGIGVTAVSHLADETRIFNDRYSTGAMKRSDLEAFLRLCQETEQIIETNLRRAAELVQSFKQVAVDQASHEKRTFDLKVYIDEVLASLRPKLKKTSHEVIVDCEPGIMVTSYPGALSQVIANLVMNSLIHGFDGKENGQITMGVTVRDERVFLVYRDNGAGIEPVNLKRIFEPFFTTRRGQGGSGLGMHIVYNLITQTLNGHITVESEPGHGVTFTVEFPRER